MGSLRSCETVEDDRLKCCTLSLVRDNGEGKNVSPYFWLVIEYNVHRSCYSYVLKE